MRKFHLPSEYIHLKIYVFDSYTAAEQSGLGFKLFLSLDMSYVITLPKPTDRPLIYRFSFPSVLFHVLLLTMRRICVTLLAHIFLTPTSCNMNLGLLSPLLLAKRARLDNPVFRVAGRASSQTIRISAGKFISFPHSLLIHPSSLILRMSWMVNSMYVYTLFCLAKPFFLTESFRLVEFGLAYSSDDVFCTTSS
jgi:hypothetical protein